jgi:chemotaxis protein MotB
MARKKGGGHGGGHGWFVTFADLMALMMSFFVMVAAFSTQDKVKLQIVAGSMREAFGVQQVRYNGIVEQDGLPTRPAPKNVAQIRPEEASNTPGPNDMTKQTEGMRMKEDQSFALAAASLRQAMQDMPEISELSKHIMIEQTEAGLNIEIVDQDGRSMFPEGSKEPFDRTRRIVEKLAVPLKALPNRVAITGHTAASRLPPRPGYGPWELSADRANAVRQILEDAGLPTSHVAMIGGKSDSQPLFPDDPHIAANRRVTITLMREAPPLPIGFKP